MAVGVWRYLRNGQCISPRFLLPIRNCLNFNRQFLYMENNRERSRWIVNLIVLAIPSTILLIPVDIMSLQSLVDLGFKGEILEKAGVDVSAVTRGVKDDVLALQIILSVARLLMLYSYYLVLDWKRKGAYLYLSVSVISALAYWYFMGNIIDEFSCYGLITGAEHLTSCFSFIVPALLLFLILRIRKNGVSCWKLMD